MIYKKLGDQNWKHFINKVKSSAEKDDKKLIFFDKFIMLI